MVIDVSFMVVVGELLRVSPMQEVVDRLSLVVCLDEQTSTLVTTAPKR